jgi:hypothetical protein
MREVWEDHSVRYGAAPLRSGGSTVIDQVVEDKLGEPVGIMLASFRQNDELFDDDFRHRVVRVIGRRAASLHRSHICPGAGPRFTAPTEGRGLTDQRSGRPSARCSTGQVATWPGSCSHASRTAIRSPKGTEKCD